MRRRCVLTGSSRAGSSYILPFRSRGVELHPGLNIRPTAPPFDVHADAGDTNDHQGAKQGCYARLECD
jgi:hypothetical protein